MVSGEWRTVSLEGSAPALPLKFSVVREHDPPAEDSQTPNKFSAQEKIRHQPLAEPMAWLADWASEHEPRYGL